MRSKSRAPAVSLLLAALVVGCSRCDGRQAVSGTISLDGKPLDSGSISFRPQGHAANGSGDNFQEGRFALPAERGLRPGKYVVTVSAFRQTGRMVQDPQRGPIPELVQIQFREVAQEVEVTDAGTNAFTFELTSLE